MLDGIASLYDAIIIIYCILCVDCVEHASARVWFPKSTMNLITDWICLSHGQIGNLFVCSSFSWAMTYFNFLILSNWNSLFDLFQFFDRFQIETGHRSQTQTGLTVKSVLTAWTSPIFTRLQILIFQLIYLWHDIILMNMDIFSEILNRYPIIPNITAASDCCAFLR